MKVQTSQADEDGNKIGTNSESGGRYHTNWLNMMYPRLRLARNLLSNDGVIFISIDDNEIENLKKLCNEVFGEENFIACIAKKTKLTSNNGTYFAPSHEYIFVIAKNVLFLQEFNDSESQEEEEYLKLFKYEDEYSKYNIVGLYQPSLTLERSRNARYYITCPDGSLCIPPENKRWRVVEGSYFEMVKNNLIVFKETKTSPLIDEKGNQSRWNIYTKIYLKDRLESGMRPATFLDRYPNSEGTKELLKLGIPFDFSKPRTLIQYLIKITGFYKEDIILDFFSGSSTTAHAVMQLNAEDGGNRKFIMVQLPEPCDEKSEAYKAGYKNICEIGKERIRRAGEKIKSELIEKQTDQVSIGEENKVDPDSLDIGFKVLKLDTSNIKKWNPDYNNLEVTLLDSINNFVDGRSELDVVFEIMLKYGIDLTFPIEEYKLSGKNVFSVGFGALVICLDNDITTALAEEIVKLKNKLSPRVMRVVFKDNGFKNDSVKTNIKEILKINGIEEIVSI